MKRAVALSCIVAMLCLIGVWGQTETDHKADHEALRLLKDKVEKAVNSQNMDELRSCLAKDFTFITADQSVLRSESELTSYYNGMLKSEKSPVIAMQTEITPSVKTQFTGQDTGYCYGTSKDVFTLRNKRKVEMQSTWSAVVVREDGTWKISIAHVGYNFLDNPVMAVNKMSWFGKLLIATHVKKMPGEVKE